MERVCSYKQCQTTRIQVIKSCHHCPTLYCSKKCRQLDWQDHKSRCVYGRLSSVCKRIVTHIGNEARWRSEASRLAWDSGGRGFVWAQFESYQAAMEFVNRLPQPSNCPNLLDYVTSTAALHVLTDLFRSGGCPDEDEEQADELNRLVRSYDPRKDFVFLVSVRLSQDSRGQVVHKFIKIPLRLKIPSRQLSSSMPVLIEPQKDVSKTLILTSLNRNEDKVGRESNEEDRQLFLANILNELQLRGVNLRQAYPNIYQDLCLYVEENRPFAPVCLFPRDVHTGQLFMCLIMPKSEPVNYPSLF